MKSKLHFEEKYFEGEMREGFYIEPMMKCVWAGQLEVMADLQEIFEKYNIQYFADWGTLLGTIRHQGYIPWDDDIDIVMTRENFQKLCELYADGGLKHYILRTIEEISEEKMGISRIANLEKFCFDKKTFDKSRLKKYHGCPYIIGPDIFVLDTLPKESEEVDIFHSIVAVLRKAIEVCEKKSSSDELEKWLIYVEEFLQVSIDRKKQIMKQLIVLFEQVSQLYNKEKGNYAEVVFWQKKKNLILKREWYEDYEMKRFENIYLPVPKGYHEILTTLYGDYMIPNRNVGGHDYPFYKKQEQLLEQWLK